MESKVRINTGKKDEKSGERKPQITVRSLFGFHSGKNVAHTGTVSEECRINLFAFILTS